MKLTFRWFGKDDPVTLEKIRQIPKMSGIVSAVYDVPAGEIWSNESILALKNSAEKAGLEFSVVESVPVHEDIKMGAKNAATLIDNYCENIRRLGKAGVKVICYNFMPVFDWLRSELERQQSDGANALAYDHKTVSEMNPLIGNLSLPGWDESYTKQQLQDLLKAYAHIDHEKLWENFQTFLEAVIPVAEQNDVKMAIHPDDPPWSLFGLPRIITGQESYERLASIMKSPYNGITLCTGSLGADPNNNLPKLVEQFAERIHFVHMRNIKYCGDLCFEESPHPSECGSLDMYAIAKALYDNGFDGYIRPDHGRMIWGETGRYGYGLFDRALGAAYITGLWEAISRN